MTTPRVIRGTRAKIFLYICGILIIIGIIACYNNTLSQLDETRKLNENCRQREENLSAQLQVISEYKQRLENSLKTEKAEHQQSKSSFESKLNDEKNRYEKYQSESKLKHNSLQQHYNLLQTEYDDFKEECSKNKKKQHEEINKLEAKLKEVQEELKKVQSSKESLKSQFLELQSENEKWQNRLKEEEERSSNRDNDVNQLTMERDELKLELGRLKENCKNLDTLSEPKLQLRDQSSLRSFNLLSQASSSLYQINNPLVQKPSENNILNAHPVGGDQQRVLDQPNNKISSSTSTAKSELKASQANLGNAPPLLMPTVTPESIKKNNVVLGVLERKKLPEGMIAKSDKREEQSELEIVNNRYINVKENTNEQIANKPAKEDIDKENGAHEEFDAPIAQNGFEGLGFGDNDHIKHAVRLNFDKKHIDNLGMNNRDKKNYDQDYKDLQNDVQLEENEEDDDADGYEDRLGRQKDPAVRN